MNVGVHGEIKRFFYNPEKKFVRFLMDNNMGEHKLIVPDSPEIVELIEFTKVGDYVNVIASEPDLTESTVIKWDNIMLKSLKGR